MKIAICLSGHLRSFEKTYPMFYSNLLSQYDCDVFIHTWDTLGYSCQYKIDNNLNSTNHKLLSINKLLNPKKIIIESSSFIEDLKINANLFAPHLKDCPKHVGHMSSMFYKIYACNELRKSYEIETGIEYDWIIRSRSDLIFNHKIIMPTLSDKLYISKEQSNNDWYNDQFAIASPAEMDLYASAYFDIPEYFRLKNEYYPEKFLLWSLNNKNIKPEWLSMNFTILR